MTGPARGAPAHDLPPRPPVPCNGCGKPVERARECYAVPTCETCLPASPCAPEMRTEAEVAAAGDDVAIGDTFARPEALGEAWEVTARRQGGAGTVLFTLLRGDRMRLATGDMLRDPGAWVRVRAL